MPQNRHQRRARRARAGRPPPRPQRVRRPAAQRFALAGLGAGLVVGPIAVLAALRGGHVPRGLLLLPAIGIALAIAALRG